MNRWEPFCDFGLELRVMQVKYGDCDREMSIAALILMYCVTVLKAPVLL